MTSGGAPDELASALTALEDRELPLLHWGVIDGVLTSEEVSSVVAEVISDHPGSLRVEQLVDELLDRALLVSAADTSGYRTRFAETLRLAVLNRQLFSRAGADWWTQGPRLVSDFRIDVRPRAYPRRDLSTERLCEELTRAGLPVSRSDRTVMDAMLGANASLSRFQVDTTRETLAALNHDRSRALIVSAGTGSGKTIAFYLPALVWLSSRISAAEFSPQILAIYPRKELLKDQLAEALRAADGTDGPTVAAVGRGLRLGALYGDTPGDIGHLQQPRFKKSWPQRGGGRVCPYMGCPLVGCKGELVWPDAAIAGGREELRCVACGHQVGGDRLGLTRESLRRQPPDILFTTTEMLHRSSSDRANGRLFGWDPGARARPRLVLLDEVHTYQGVHGAQVALLLRRWRHAVGRPVTFVGLSATLTGAQQFMMELTGLASGEVRHVEVQPDDMVSVGRQYQIALQGDPTSGASLLSTTIQTVMLLGRVLTPASASEPLFGSKGFVFTDNLDVVNRLYHDLRDAEGRGWMSRRRNAAEKVLANLRSPSLPDRVRRAEDGQSWDLIQAVGHGLPGLTPARPLDIAKTNSQDPGVAAQADMVVATASLDVGYNDPAVGLVVQHKAPRNGAQFLQRRGRAGRLRQMRPLVAVALSDYGRDRIAFQSYEALFDPDVPARHLPVGNRYVQRMQATLALTDWLTRTTPGIDDARSLLQPESARSAALPRIANRLEELLVDENTQASLSEFLQRALRIGPDDALAILWEPPRALISTVVPTLLRRARSAWQSLATDPGDVRFAFAPDFVPAALFQPLAVPEVELVLPGDRDDLDTSMSVAQALNEISPGRVSKRFASDSGAQRTWVPPRDTNGLGVLDLASFVTSGEVLGRWADTDRPYVVVRPTRISLQQPPMNVRDTAQSEPLWRTDIVAPDPGFAMDVPKHSRWAQMVTSVQCFTHARHGPVEVRRFMVGACPDLRDGTPNARTPVSFVDRHGSAAALGFALPVDALRFDISVPPDHEVLRCDRCGTAPWRALELERRLTTDPILIARANIFQIRWLQQAVVLALAFMLVDNEHAADEVVSDLTPEGLARAVTDVLALLSPSLPDDGHDEPDDEGADTPTAVGHPGRQVQRVLDLLADGEVPVILLQALQEVFSGHASQTPALVAAHTFAAAIHAAVLRVLPDVDEQDLALDFALESNTVVWLTETTAGGAGAIERFELAYQEDPRRFWRLVGACLEPADVETVDDELGRLLSEVVGTPAGATAAALQRARTAESNQQLTAAFGEFMRLLQSHGGSVTHAVARSIAARPLRPGWTPVTDAQVVDLLRAKADLENRIGLEIDERAWSLLVGRARSLVTPATRLLEPTQIYSLLWPQTRVAFNRHLEVLSQYRDPIPLDRELLQQLVPASTETVDVTDEGWLDRARETLVEEGAVELRSGTADAARLRAGLMELVGSPLEVEFLLLHPVVTSVQRSRTGIRVAVELREAMH